MFPSLFIFEPAPGWNPWAVLPLKGTFAFSLNARIQLALYTDVWFPVFAFFFQCFVLTSLFVPQLCASLAGCLDRSHGEYKWKNYEKLKQLFKQCFKRVSNRFRNPFDTNQSGFPFPPLRYVSDFREISLPIFHQQRSFRLTLTE